MAYALSVDEPDGLVDRHAVRVALDKALVAPIFERDLREKHGTLPGQQADMELLMAGGPAPMRGERP